MSSNVMETSLDVIAGADEQRAKDEKAERCGKEKDVEHVGSPGG